MRRKTGFPWWLIFIFTCFLSWLSLFIAGIITENKKWIIAGLIYAVPMFLIYTVEDSQDMAKEKERVMMHLTHNKTFSPTDSLRYIAVIEMYEELKIIEKKLKTIEAETKQNTAEIKTRLSDRRRELKDAIDKTIELENPNIKDTGWERFVRGLWIISVIAAFAHALAIRKRYWELYYGKTRGRRTKSGRTNPLLSETSFTEHSEIIKKRIEQKIKKSDYFDSIIVRDIMALAQTFTEQIKQLETDKLHLKNSEEIAKIAELENDLSVLKNKLRNEVNPRLSREYKETVIAKEKLLNSYKDLAIYKKTIDLRLEKALDSLRQAEYDLDRLNKAYNTEKQIAFFDEFKRKTEDLGNYADELHQEMKKSKL